MFPTDRVLKIRFRWSPSRANTQATSVLGHHQSCRAFLLGHTIDKGSVPLSSYGCRARKLRIQSLDRLISLCLLHTVHRWHWYYRRDHHRCRYRRLLLRSLVPNQEDKAEANTFVHRSRWYWVFRKTGTQLHFHLVHSGRGDKSNTCSTPMRLRTDRPRTAHKRANVNSEQQTQGCNLDNH